MSDVLPRYDIKEYWRHGEAASVNLDTVEKERGRISEILKGYAKRDQFNMDETGLFGL